MGEIDDSIELTDLQRYIFGPSEYDERDDDLPPTPPLEFEETDEENDDKFEEMHIRGQIEIIHTTLTTYIMIGAITHLFIFLVKTCLQYYLSD